ncbi:MAG: putative baseplate assembly protein [Alphaproteobacteria bacterium]
MTGDAAGSIWCRDERRRGDVVNHPGTLNGLDFVEFFEDDAAPPEARYRIEATFLKPPPPALVGSPGAFTVDGGARIVGIRVLDVTAHVMDALRLNVFVDRAGDFSTYGLSVAHADMDPLLASAPFGFKASCPTDFDCRSDPECPEETPEQPLIDYLAKDYQSFRRLLLDLIPQRNPRWLERNPADLGMALVELFAYAGDHLSYFQDAVATEAYLDTCRQRISAKRHARLIDYRMHDGRNAWTFVQFEADGAGVVPQGTQLATRVARPLRGQIAAPGPVIGAGLLDFDSDPALQGVSVFETTARAAVHPDHNELRVHTWGDARCCLGRGTREVWLYGLPAVGGADRTAYRPHFVPGDYLVIEEVGGPVTGLAADADPAHRHVVRVEMVEDATDPVYAETLTDGRLNPLAAAGDPPLPLQRVVWGADDALPFAACISADTPETGPIGNLTLVRGNVAPCDHGRTVIRPLPTPAALGTVVRTALPDGPLTMHAAPEHAVFDDAGRMVAGRHERATDARSAQPAVVLILEFPPNETEIWTPVPDLLDSGPFDRHFVVDVDDAGRASIRFGDDAYGARPLGAAAATARYRIGNGRAGNLGHGALVHVATPAPADLVDPAVPAAGPVAFPGILRVRQPLAAGGGVEPETIEEVRQLAPRAFQAEQFRAVTEADYEKAALAFRGIAAAKATFRWTGSWHTVFVAAHPAHRDDLVTLPGGGADLTDDLRERLTAHLVGYKLAGYDLRVRAAHYVPLEVEVEICVARGHFRGAVLEAVARALRSFFAPAAFAFGQPVYLSRLYAAVEAVAGVDSAHVTVFKRFWESPNGEIGKGLIPMAAFEIPRLDADPNFRENGVLRLIALGGS